MKHVKSNSFNRYVPETLTNNNNNSFFFFLIFIKIVNTKPLTMSHVLLKNLKPSPFKYPARILQLTILH